MLLVEKLSYLIFLVLIAILVFKNQYAEKYEVYGGWKGEFKNYESDAGFVQRERIL